LSAVKQALALMPDVLFFDIRMPGLDGLDAAAELADAWPTGQLDSKPFPQLVFVTAYDQYAVRAFEVHAVDYLLKPVQADRLKKTAEKLQFRHTNRANIAINSVANKSTNAAAGTAAEAASAAPDALAHAVNQLRHLLAAAQALPAAPSAVAPLKMIQASVGSQIRMVPVDEVIYFEAADKYVRVLTAQHEYLIRTPLKELLPQLDMHIFWQIHRGTVVRAEAIESITRDETGKQLLSLRGCADKLPVSRLYAHLFKAM
jgi:DNA-binding LytR/AlgR family response regulator